MIHLHIGRHKTGTSALQRFFARNRPALRRAGVDYPQAADGRAAHHDIALGLNRARLAKLPPEARARALAAVEEAGVWLAEPGDKLVSSEAFQNIPARDAATLFPPGATGIIVYLREPLDYLISAYAQAIQAQPIRTPFAEYAARFRPDYVRFLDDWAGVFGPERLRVRIYDRESFPEGDIRRDFLSVLGLEAERFRFEHEMSNPSIGPELIEFKGVLNAVLSPAEQQDLRLYNHLARIAPSFPARFTVPAEFQAAYRVGPRATAVEVFDRYLGRPGEGFRSKDFSGEPLKVDLDAVAERALAAIEATAPAAGRRLRKRLPAKLADVAPRLLPEDWSEAARGL